LKRRLGDLYASRTIEFQISNEGRSLFKFLSGRGRIGRRFAPRFWETESTLGRDRELLIVVCKKWHVAKRLLSRIRSVTGLICIEYLFDEEGTPLPDLGGIQVSIGKRARHRRALMRMLFDYYQIDRMVVCLDPNNMDLMRDFFSDRSTTKLLEIECEFSDAYLLGHAKRVGLAGERTGQETIDVLLPTIRSDVVFESDKIRDAGFENVYRIREASRPEENAGPLSKFLDVSEDRACEITRTDYLFVD
jgi:hypothetical protein